MGERQTRSSRALALAGLLFALLSTLAYPPVNFWPLTVAIPLPLAWLALRARTTRQALVISFLTSMLAWLWMNRWIMHITAFGYPALCLYMSIYAMLFVWILRRCAAHPVIGWAPMAMLVPVIWVGVEFLRGDVVAYGYPWFLLGHPLIEWPAMAQSADLFGAYLVCLLAAIPAGVALDLCRAEWSKRRRILVGTIAAVILVANAGYGTWRIGQTPNSSPSLHVLLIQTNLPQDNKNKWTPEQQYEDVQRFVQMTTDALAQARERGVEPDLLAWPETMLPGLGFEPDAIKLVKTRFSPSNAHLYLWHESVQQLVPHWNVPALIGSGATVDAKIEMLGDGRGQLAWSARYNSAYLLTPSGQVQRYDKYFLTPFGETMPYISAWPWLEERLLALGPEDMSFSLDSSDDLTRLTLPADGTTFSTPICFEDTVARVCRRMVWDGGEKRSMMLINLSNDGWFGFFDGGRAHHVQIARFRAIENRVPVLRSVNTGYSVSIDSSGRVTGAIGEEGYGDARQPGSLLAAVTLDDRRPLYAAVGELLPWLLLAATATLLGLTFVLGRGQPKIDDPKPD